MDVRVSKDVRPTTAPGRHLRLVCLTGRKKGLSYYLGGGRTTLGRGKECGVTVFDEGASRLHAEIVVVGGKAVLTDLKSASGVVVNDGKVTQRRLEDGDVVVIGRVVYRFHVIVNEEGARREEPEDAGEENAKGGPPPGERRRGRMMGILGVALLYLLLWDDGGGEDPGGALEDARGGLGAGPVRGPAFASGGGGGDEEQERKLRIYMHRGVREYREGNYFRAITEFDMALMVDPNDGRALFYKNRAENRIDETVDKLFMNAARDKENLKYGKALTSLCEAKKFLWGDGDEERRERAKEMMGEILSEMKAEPDEDYCSAQ